MKKSYGGMAMKTTLFLKILFFLLPAAGIPGIAACKGEPALPGDPHVPLVNPFPGVWRAGPLEYWLFRGDGTGGRAALAEGPFPDDFCFLVYAGQDSQTAPPEGTLVLLDDSGSGDAAMSRWEFQIEGNHAELTAVPGTSLTLERVRGGPDVLVLTNMLTGEWSADWPGLHGLTWSFKYRSDGTVKAFHHGAGHQFENAYVLRGNTLVIFGAWRFGAAPVRADITVLDGGRLLVTETQAEPPPAEWTYTKVNAAEWL
jgi:hypothetical protein